MPEYDDDLALLTTVARAAGDIALSFWKKTPEVWEKDGGLGPVTAADLAIDRMLLAELGAARRDYGWLSEETPDNGRRLQSDRVFIIDPIDGTRAFIDGSADFAHSLAIADRGRIVAAVVYLPARQALYAATADSATTLNGQPVRSSARGQSAGATLLTARSNLDPSCWKAGQLPEVKRTFRSSIAWRLCLVAEGAFDGMLTLRPTCEWDVAAGALIVEQAGARVSDRRGQAPLFNRADPRLDGCLAAPHDIHEDLIQRLAAP
ncbi:MAG: 3'(2'),5'-bisphosphate nucleotidase CysQ [Paracoccaceae bacterium]